MEVETKILYHPLLMLYNFNICFSTPFCVISSTAEAIPHASALMTRCRGVEGMSSSTSSCGMQAYKDAEHFTFTN